MGTNTSLTLYTGYRRHLKRRYYAFHKPWNTRNGMKLSNKASFMHTQAPPIFSTHTREERGINISRHTTCNETHYNIMISSIYIHTATAIRDGWDCQNCTNICTFRIKVDHQVLEYVHVSCVGYGAGGRGIPLAVDESYGLSANLENQRVHQRHTVLVTRITRHLKGGGRVSHTVFVPIVRSN